jgi:hypothetical protein
MQASGTGESAVSNPIASETTNPTTNMNVPSKALAIPAFVA